jgi:hypothetical protein
LALLDSTTIQRTLARLGYWDRAPDGDLRDEAFSGALRCFQRDCRVTADGRYGPDTDAKLQPYVDVLAKSPAGFGAARRWKLTYYYVADESVFAAIAPTVPVYGNDRQVLAHVAPHFFAQMALEGTGRLRDGRLLRVSGRYVPVAAADYTEVLDYARANHWLPDKPGYAGIGVDGDQVSSALAFFEVPEGKRGCGYGIQERRNPVSGQALSVASEPFRTLAADLGLKGRHDPDFLGKGGVVPVGTRVWIMELVGAVLPDGSIHDGWCVVNDTGGGIFGAHFDVFTGTAALAKRVAIPDHGHVWFEGIEARLPLLYAYGL